MSIYRIGYGVIFDDEFGTLDTRWLVSPSDSYTHDPNAKQCLKHSHKVDKSTNALFEIPKDEDNLLLQVHAEYKPTHIGDEGGIVVWRNAMDKVEFLESEDTTSEGEYSVWRTTKRGNLWSFFAEKEGTWELFDSTVCVEPVMAGVVLKGKQREGYQDLKVGRVILCRGSSVTVGNIESGHKIVLVGGDSREVQREQEVPYGYSGADIELPTIPFYGTIEVHAKRENGEYEKIDGMDSPISMYGGDLFLKGTELTVLWKGSELEENTPTHLGTMRYDVNEQKMTLLNKSEETVAENIKLKVAMYNEEWGWEWADLAHDVEGSPGTYQDVEITFDRLDRGETKDFWVKVTKEDDGTGWSRRYMRPSYFMLEITNE